MTSRGPAPVDDAVTTRDPRAEAQGVVGPAFAARVLEPSPPAVGGEWLADDPVFDGTEGATAAGALVVAPVPGGWTTWDEWLAEHPEYARWAGARWLGAFHRLPPPPPALGTTRLALHRLAVSVVAPARQRVNGKIGLRYTYGGFGTPFFGDDEQVRVAGTRVVHQRRGETVDAPITTLARAGALVLAGPPDATWAAGLDAPAVGDPDEPLPVEPHAAAFLGDWFGFAFSVLEALRAEPDSSDVSRVQLWPEHFDAAFDCLPEADGRRATFGVSPGDAAVDEPYLYVNPWRTEGITPGALWNATSFRGAILPWSELAGHRDQRAGALEFFRRRRRELLA